MRKRVPLMIAIKPKNKWINKQVWQHERKPENFTDVLNKLRQAHPQAGPHTVRVAAIPWDSQHGCFETTDSKLHVGEKSSRRSWDRLLEGRRGTALWGRRRERTPWQTGDGSALKEQGQHHCPLWEFNLRRSSLACQGRNGTVFFFQTEKDKHHLTSLVRGLWRTDWTSKQNRQTQRHGETDGC